MAPTGSEPQEDVKELRSQLAASEDRLHSFMNLMGHAFCCVRFEPRVATDQPVADQAATMLGAHVEYCNQAFAEMSGADAPDSLQGSRFVSLFGMSDESLISRAERFVRSGYCINEFESTERLIDGSTRCFSNTSRGEIEHGHLVRAWVLKRDITLRRLVESAADQDETNLRRAAEDADATFWVLDWNELRMLHVGPNIEQRWGITERELLRDPLCWLEHVHEADRQRVQNSFLSHAGNGDYDETFRVWMPDGSLGWVRDRCFILPGRTDDQLHLAGIAQDVTDVRRAKTGFRRLFDVATEFLFVMDSLGVIRHANDAMASALERHAPDLSGLPLLDLLHEDDRSAFRQMLSRLASGKPVARELSRLQKTDGTYCHVEWHAAPVADDGRIYAAARDATGDVHADEERAAREEATKRLSRLSPRERQITELVASGLANKAIARQLNISLRTVETHRSNLMKKLQLRNVAELLRLVLQADD